MAMRNYLFALGTLQYQVIQKNCMNVLRLASADALRRDHAPGT
jgi:hypothetical protein